MPVLDNEIYINDEDIQKKRKKQKYFLNLCQLIKNKSYQKIREIGK